MVKQKETMGFKEVLADLKKGIVGSLYVFEGDEAYLKNKLLKALESILIDPSAKTLDHIVFDYTNQASKVDFEQIKDEIMTPPFLSKRRLVVIKHSGLFLLSGKSKVNTQTEIEESAQNDEEKPQDNPAGSSKERQAQLIGMIQSITDSCCLVFVEDKVDKRMKSLVDAINEYGTLATISKPDFKDIRIWVKAELSKEGISITPEACDYFIDRNDGNLQSMVCEIEKLVLFAQSKNKDSIDKIEIDEIGSSDFKGSIFDIVDSLSRSNAQEAYRLLDLLIVQKQPVPFISFMLARHVRQLITAKDLGSVDRIIKKMKVIPFVANKLFYQSKNFTFDALEELYKECYETDLAVKTSKIQDRLALETLFASFINKNRTDSLIKKTF